MWFPPSLLYSIVAIASTFIAAGQPLETIRSNLFEQIPHHNFAACMTPSSRQTAEEAQQGCLIERKSKLINLAIDQNNDGVADQLLAAVRDYRIAVSSARTLQEYQSANAKFEARLPYSNQVKRLQARQRQLQKRVKHVTRSEYQKIYRQLSDLQQKIDRHPSYQNVQNQIWTVNLYLYQNSSL